MLSTADRTPKKCPNSIVNACIEFNLKVSQTKISDTSFLTYVEAK